MRTLPLLVGLLVAAPLAAQDRPIAPASSILFAATAAPTAPVDSMRPLSRDPRQVGAGLGIVLGLVGAYVLGSHTGVCTDVAPSSCDKVPAGIGSYVLGASVGGILGYLIGDKFAR